MKNIILLSISFLIFISQVSSQDSKFSFGIESNLGISDRIYISEDEFTDIIKETQSKIEKPKFGYELGFIVEYKISESMTIQSGLKYISWGYKSDKQSFNASGDPAFPNEIQYESQNIYIDIPLKFNIYKTLLNQNIYASVGISPGINISNKNITTQYFDDRTEHTKVEDDFLDYRKINPFFEIGVGWQKSISENLDIFLNPNFRIQSFGIATDAPLNRRLMFYGVNFGIKFSV